jgi:hypothetical protein
MPYGTHKLLGAASTAAAWRDWHTLEAWCVQNGHSELASRQAPKQGAGHKTIDKKIEKLRVALGAPAGAWENVLDGLTPPQPQLPPAVRPIVEEALATGDLVKANEELHRPSGSKTVRQVVEEWAQQMQPPADPEQREQQQGGDRGRLKEAEAAWWAAWRANREEATRRWEAEGSIPNRWDQIFDEVCREGPLPTHPLRVQEDLETWVRGTQLAPDEQRHVLELFPESRSKLNLSPDQWLEQTAFRLRKDGSLDLRHRCCRINPGAGPDEPYRYHRAPRYRRPDPPRRQAQREQQQQEPEPPTQLPPVEPRPSRPAEENAYGVRVWNAYRELAEQYQAIDVPIHALHRRVGGSLLELQNHLRAECLGHRAVATTGEPAFAGDAARQSALRLPGESETFLNIKLLNPPPMSQQQPEPQRQVASLNRDDLAVIIEALEYRCDVIEGGTDFDEVARLKSIAPTLEKLRAIEAQPQRPEHERYESLLRATAALRYPAEERTAELEVRIEKTIARKVGEFTQERRAKAYEVGLRKELTQRHPNLTPEQAERYERRINDLVAEFQKNQAQQQHDVSRRPDPDRQQGRGRGIDR